MIFPNRCIDLNCDLGEGAGHDAELMALITSANVACGAHAGDEATMRATVALAQKHGVAVGAHPGFADRASFGRREPVMDSSVVAVLCYEQIQFFQGIAWETKVETHHVKLHGALYNIAARNRYWADAICNAIWATDREPIIYAPWGSELAKAATSIDLRVAYEVFADRTYQADGSLTPRTQADALIDDEDVAVAQVLRMVREGVVRATDGTEVPIVADTVCLHGDGAHAVAFARRLNTELRAAGISLRAFGA